MQTSLSWESQLVLRANEALDQLSLPSIAALDSRLGRQVMELFRKVAHEQGAGVIVVTHDHRALDVFDVIYEMEDGIIRPASADLVRTVSGAPASG